MALHNVLTFVTFSRVCAISANPCFGNHFHTLVRQIVEFFSVHQNFNLSCIFDYHNTPSNFGDTISIFVEQNIARYLNVCSCIILLTPICNSPHWQFLLLTIIQSSVYQSMFSPFSALQIDLPDYRKDTYNLYFLKSKGNLSPSPLSLLISI